MSEDKKEDYVPFEDQADDKPIIPKAGVIYGDIIYWGTIAGTFVVLLGSFITFTTTNNYMDPAILLSAIWEGKSVDEIWTAAAGGPPDGHWYLSVPTTGNGLTAIGIAMGVFSVTPAIAASAYVLWKDGYKFFAGIAVTAAIITMLAMLA